MRHPARIALILLAALVAACTMVPPEERAAACQATDWHDYGFNDGVLGVPVADRAKKFADCADLGHPADIAAYTAARRDGLERYCTLENGYEVGYSGRRYRGVCPPELEPDFLQGYTQGRRERPAAGYYYPYFGFGYYTYPRWWYGYPYPHYLRHR